MSRIYWDTMLFIYLLEGHSEFAPRVDHLLQRVIERQDELYTSHLTMGEILAGAAKSPDPAKTRVIRETIAELGVKLLPFDGGAVEPFSRLRAVEKLQIADSIHLACAASAGIDLLLTGDKRLSRLKVPGIHFIADMHTDLL